MLVLIFTCSYMFDLLSCLEYVHKRNVLYRDVKPSNIMWDEEKRQATLIDFDVATFFDPEDLHRRCVGTDGYMAPEVLSVSDEVERLESLDRVSKIF